MLIKCAKLIEVIILLMRKKTASFLPMACPGFILTKLHQNIKLPSLIGYPTGLMNFNIISPFTNYST